MSQPTATAAELSAPLQPGDGAAPQRTAFFNQMAAALSEAAKGSPKPAASEAPAAPAAPAATPPKPAEPAAKPPEKPAEKPVEKPAEKPADDLPDNFEHPNYVPNPGDWKKMRDRIKEGKALKAEKATLEAEMARLKAEVEKAKSAAPAEPVQTQPPAELETLKKSLEDLKAERDRYQTELKAVALERAPEFREHFEKRFAVAMETAKAAVPPEKQAQVDALMQIPNTPYRKALLSEVMADLDEADKASLAVAVMEMDRARKEKADALKEQEVNFKRLQDLEAKKREDQEKSMAAQRSQAVNQVLAAARENFEAFKPSQDESHMAFVKRSENRVQAFFDGSMDPNEIAILPVIASEYELLKARHEALVQERDKLAEAVKSYQSSSGSVEAGSQTSATEPKGFKEKFLANWKPSRR